MSNWIPKDKTLKFFTALAALSVLLYFCGLFIVFREIKKVENSQRDTESESFKEKKFLAVKSIAESNEELIKSMRNFFIQKDGEAKMVEDIEEAAKNSGIKFEISSIDLKEDTASPIKDDVLVKIFIEGRWERVISFIDRLGKLPFGVSIEEISLDADSPGVWTGYVEFVLFREK